MQVGDTEGHFEILELLGSGVLTTVYRARNTRLDRIVALKILLRAADEKMLRRFRDEARRMVRIHTPYVVTVYTLEELNVGPAIEMEYLEGGSLADRLRVGPPISVAEGKRYLEHALLGLQEIHQEGIVHRDIKPANIMFERKGHLRIGDFGIAALEGDLATVHAATLQYAAPELIVTGKFDRRVDLYSLGMTAYEMFLGSERYGLVFREVVGGCDDIRHTNWLAWHADPARKAPPLKDLIEIDEETSDVVARLMEKDREQRFQSADAALVLLRTAKSVPKRDPNPPTVKLNEAEESLTGTPTGFGLWVQNLAPKSRLTRLVTVVAVMGILAGLALYAILRTPASGKVASAFDSVALLMDFETRGIRFDNSGGWAIDDRRAHTGRFSVHSPLTADGESHAFQVQAPDTAGRVSFFYLVSAEPRADFLIIRVNGKIRTRLGDTGGAWKETEVLLRPGPNNLITWEYAKDMDTSQGEDRAWVDDIRFLTPSREENPNLIDFETGSIPAAIDGEWEVDNSRSFRGAYSAHSPPMSDNRSKTFRVTAPTGKGWVSFYYYVSSETCCDYLSVKVNSGPSRDFKNTGERWRSAEIELSPNQPNQIAWTYHKDGSTSEGDDRAWVDNIEFHDPDPSRHPPAQENDQHTVLAPVPPAVSTGWEAATPPALHIPRHPPPPVPGVNLRIANHSGYRIDNVYVSETNDWGDDLLGRNYWETGYDLPFNNIKAGNYNFRFVDKDKDVCIVRNRSVMENSYWIIEKEWLLRCEGH